MGIQRLNQGTPTSASQIPFGDTSNGCDRRCSVGDLAEVIAPLIPSAGGDFVTQYFAPNATGWSVPVTPPDAGDNVFLLITPNAGYAAGTITMPAAGSCVDQQQVLVTSTQAAAALTVAGNGAVVNGAPAALVTNGFFRLRFDGVFKAWYRVG